MKIFFLVPDGIGVRNYLYSDIIAHLKEHELGLLHELPQIIVDEVEQLHQKKLVTEHLPKYAENRKVQLLRDTAYFTRLRRKAKLRKNRSLWLNLIRMKHPKGKKKLYYDLLMFLGKLSGGSMGITTMLEKRYTKEILAMPVTAKYQAVLEKHRPDIIICTNQRSHEAGPVMEAAKRLGIPTVMVIYSWDNLPKNHFSFSADKYIVWSTYMANEMAMYYPDVPKENVFILGTPQFEHYKNPNIIWSREKFFDYYKLDRNKKIICFSGNDLTSPNDQHYLKDICERLMQLPESQRPHILFRRSPVDTSDRFDAVCEQYKSLVTIANPEWLIMDADNYAAIYPNYRDLEVLTNVCYHTDLVINIGSTMGLDYAHFDRPAVYLNYHQPYNESWYDIKFIYQFEHFRSLDGLDAVIWINSADEIVPKIMAGLNTPNSVATERLLWKKRLTDDITTASANIAARLLEWGKH